MTNRVYNADMNSDLVSGTETHIFPFGGVGTNALLLSSSGGVERHGCKSRLSLAASVPPI